MSNMKHVKYNYSQRVVQHYYAEKKVPDEVIAKGDEAIKEHLHSNFPDHEELRDVTYGEYDYGSFEVLSVEEETT